MAKNGHSIDMKRLNAGFTMIELLIVIAIIGILVVAGIGAFFSSLGRGRDSQRISEVKGLQSAFEIYYTTEGQYDDFATMVDDTRFVKTEPEYESEFVTPGVANGYCVCIALERDGEDRHNSDSACNYDASPATHYCVSNLQ